MAQIQRTGTGWIPVRRLLYLAGHLHMLRDQGKDGSKQLPRGYYRRKAHEKKKKKVTYRGICRRKGKSFQAQEDKAYSKGGIMNKSP